tara:strand:+ start:178 stop:294 length:117 start_codon:yes stop_codon:yes gene_type:complete
MEPILLREGVLFEAGQMLMTHVLNAGCQKEKQNGYTSL